MGQVLGFEGIVVEDVDFEALGAGGGGPFGARQKVEAGCVGGGRRATTRARCGLWMLGVVQR